MARRSQYQELYVYMNEIHVGTLVRGPVSHLQFTYDQSWLDLKDTRPISLSMPLTEIPYKGAIVDYYFDNLLPDSDLIRQRIQARFNSPSKKCFDLLSLIGGDCVGALQILTQPKVKNARKISAVPMTEQKIARLLMHYKTAPLGMDRELDFRISIAGAQEKTALLWYKNRWHLPQGTTPTSHIVKLPIGKIEHSGIDLSESVENEWLCLKILSAYHLPVNQAKIVQFEKIKTLVVERFDRRWTQKGDWLMRLPQEDLCQALGRPGGLKYEADGGPGIQDMMNILLGSSEAANDRKRFMKSVFLFWVLGAIDGHGKNFSFYIGPQGRYQLTPLYDVISAYPLAAKKQIEWSKLKMAMALKSKNKHYLWNMIQLRHWLIMAKRCQFSEFLMQEIIDEVCDNMEGVIQKVSQTLPPSFPRYICEPIFSGMRQIKKRINF